MSEVEQQSGVESDPIKLVSLKGAIYNNLLRDYSRYGDVSIEVNLDRVKIDEDDCVSGMFWFRVQFPGNPRSMLRRNFDLSGNMGGQVEMKESGFHMRAYPVDDRAGEFRLRMNAEGYGSGYETESIKDEGCFVLDDRNGASVFRIANGIIERTNHVVLKENATKV